MQLLAAAAAAAAPLSSLRSLSSHGPRIPFPCEARPRAPLRRGDLAIRMGGGPRTFPGGVSKWQWKRMQARKAKQLLKARLARERQLYEMRKRAELRDAVAHLERPWDPDASAPAAAEVAPNLLSVAADDQLKALADRFHRPGGVDLWNDRDGPQVFASPGTGMSSARFFPKNAVHSVQPYALLGGDAESPLDARGNDGDGTDRSDRVQGVRENAAKKEMLGIRGDHEPAVEYIERGGVWEPVDSLDDGDDNNSSDHGWNFDNITSDLEEDMALGDVGFRPKQRAMDGREGRKGGMARWAATTSMAASVNGVRDRYGNDFSLSPEGTSQYHLGQRWQARNSGGRGNRPSGRGPALNTGVSGAIRKDRTVGGTSFSDSEVTRDGFEPKWRARNREGTTNGVRRWKPNGSSANVPTKGWMGDDFGSNSDSGRDFMLEPKWKTRNRLNRSENNDGHANAPKKGWMDDDFGSNSETTRDTMLEPKWETLNRSNQSKYDSGKRELKYSPNSYNRERPERSMRGSNGNGRRDRFVNRFASDLEEPKWKPRRKDGTRTNSGSREHVDSTNGRFRRSSNGAARLLDARPLDTNSGASGEDGGHRTSRNGGRRSRGNGYSLRPTSDLRSPGRERGSDEM